MRGALAQKSISVATQPWQLEVGRLLNEQHLCAWSDNPRQRERFVSELSSTLSKFDDTYVCTLDGTRTLSLDAVITEFEHALAVGHLGRTIDGVRGMGGAGGLVGALRRRPHISGVGGAPPIKRRFIIWTDAHLLLQSDPKLFGRIADALMGVAAEHEFCSDDVLLIQRAVFVGRAALDVYAEDPRGQFRSWYSEFGEAPLWRVVTGRDSPSVARWKIGHELGV